MKAAQKTQQPEPKAKINRLNESRLQPGSYFSRPFQAMAIAGLTLSDVMEPSFWASVASRFKRYDTIQLMTDDQAFYAHLMVTDVAPRIGVQLAILSYVEIPKVDNELPQIEDNYQIMQQGGKWSILRKDGVYIRQGLDSKDEALFEMKAHIAALS